MNRKLAMAAGVTAGAAVALTGRTLIRRRHRQAGREDPGARWHSVTVNCEPEQLGPKPPPLDEIGTPIEIRVRPAPGDRGTELAVRLVEPPPRGIAGAVARARGDDPVRLIRSALRRARSLAEVGEVLLPDTPATTKPTALGAPLAYATRHGREEGRI